jgi:iron complex transport system substrate-binding protein
MNAVRTYFSLLAVLAVLLVGACSSDSDGSGQSDPSASGGSYPVTIDHRLGSTTIPAKPERIVALGVPDVDVLLAVGVTPVAVLMADDWPWQIDKIDEAKTEIMPYSADGPNYEKIAALEPDLILATGLGGNDAYYGQLSQIAPTLADKDGVLTTDWKTTAREIGRAIGETAAVEKAVTSAEQVVKDARQAHPAAEGATYSAGFIYTPGAVSVETSADLPQARLLADLGLTVESSIATEILNDSADSSQVGAGTTNVAYEKLGVLNAADALIVGFTDDSAEKMFEEQRLVQELEAVKAGHYLALDRFGYTAGSFVTIGSIPFAIEALTPLLDSFDGR